MKNDNPKKLTAKQSDFVRYYADVGSDTVNNATQSAIKAGYTPKTANIASDQLLGNIRIKKAIEDYKAEKAKVMDVKAEQIISDLRHAQAISLEANDRQSYIRATELLGKTLALFTDRVQSEAEQPTMSDEERARLKLVAKNLIA